MVAKKHLFVGFGNIASLCAAQLTSQGEKVIGVSRSPKPLIDGVSHWYGDIKSPEMLARIGEETFSSVVITMTPGGRGPAAYRAAYYDVVQALLDQWKRGNAPERIIFVSSTSVYGQSMGECVDEKSETKPQRETAQVLLATEKLLRDSELVSTCVRFSGIYGPGRNYLLKQVKQGDGGNQHYTNRIHIEDCAGVICHLLQLNKDMLTPIYLASDQASVTSANIRQWLAEQMGINAAALSVENGSVGGKRCDSSHLVDSGYQFKYPSYETGYIDPIALFMDEDSEKN